MNRWITMIAAGALVSLAAAIPSFAGDGATEGSAAQEIDAKALFTRDCAMCHGAEGKGDGPAGAAFNPKPADMSVAAFWEGRTDESVTESITSGKGAMPAFGSKLSAEEIAALVAYIRELSGGESGAAR